MEDYPEHSWGVRNPPKFGYYPSGALFKFPTGIVSKTRLSPHNVLIGQPVHNSAYAKGMTSDVAPHFCGAPSHSNFAHGCLCSIYQCCLMCFFSSWRNCCWKCLLWWHRECWWKYYSIREWRSRTSYTLWCASCNRWTGTNSTKTWTMLKRFFGGRRNAAYGAWVSASKYC